VSFEFHKMHGAGNDFVLIDARGSDFSIDPRRAAHIADRHLGVGCDQLIVLREPVSPQALLRYEIWNADGSAAAQCGNGARCVGLFLALAGAAGDAAVTVDSPAGPVELRRCPDGEYEVVMGVPDFGAAQVQPELPRRGNSFILDSRWGDLELATVSMGNPHALLLVDDIDDPGIPAMGQFISTHQSFPEGCNSGFAELLDRRSLRLRVVERGAGETLACGSGACAAVAILRRSGRVDDTVYVDLPGGRLLIRWPADNEPMTMKGPAEHVFRGTMNE
jgi:diaminopimelate epimerase